MMMIITNGNRHLWRYWYNQTEITRYQKIENKLTTHETKCILSNLTDVVACFLYCKGKGVYRIHAYILH